MKKLKKRIVKIILSFTILSVPFIGLTQIKADSIFFEFPLINVQPIYDVINHYQVLEKKIEELGEEQSSAYFLCQLKLAENYKILGSSLITDKYSSRAKNLLELNNNHLNQYYSSFVNGQMKIHEGKFEEAVDLFNRAQYIRKAFLNKKLDKINIAQHDIKLNSNLAIAFFQQSDYIQFEYYLDRAIDIAKKNHLLVQLAILYYKKSMVHPEKERNNIDSLNFYTKKSLHLLDNTTIHLYHATLYNHLSALAVLDKNPQLASTYIDSALLFTKKFPNEKAEVHSKYLLSEIYLLEKEFEKAYSLLHRVHTKQYLSSKTDQQKLTKKLEELFKLKEKELALTKASQGKKIYGLGMIAGGIIIILLIYLLIKLKSEHQKRKENAQLKLKYAELEANQLKNDLSLKNRELKDFATNISLNHKVSEHIHQGLTAFKKSEDKNIINELLVLLTNELHRNKNAQVLLENIDKVNYAFFEKLKAHTPDLTASELQFLALVHLNLTTKEIASIKRVAPTYVDSKKTKLKKKLGGPKDRKLNEYLVEIFGE